MSKGLWDFKKPPQGIDWLNCKCQLDERRTNDAAIQTQMCASQKRKKIFEGALRDTINPYFSTARKGLLEEEEVVKKLQQEAELYRVHSFKESRMLIFWNFFVPFLLSFVAGRLMLIHYARSIGVGEIVKWKTTYTVFSILGASSIILTQVVTSVFSIHGPIWFGWMSFCISPWAWFSMWLSFIGLGMAVAYPSTIIWCYSRSCMRPKSLDFQSPYGSCGVGSYVLFLQTWSVLIFIFVILGSVVYIDIDSIAGRFSFWYAVPPALLMACAFLVGSRLVWNGVCIRLEYQKQLISLGRTRDIQALKLPPDPTIGFLGDNWWKLPATIIGAFTVMWTIAQILLRHDIFSSR